jgi:hypothetical protein
MKKAYEGVARFIRWGIIDVIAAIIALPVFTSVVSSI